MNDHRLLPRWAVELVADLIRHEDEHPASDVAPANHGCVAGIVSKIPADVKAYAAGWASGYAAGLESGDA